jgi:predicted nucleic acid-binding protein
LIHGNAVPVAILDTCVLIDGAPELDAEIAISTVSLAELHHGVCVAFHPAVRSVRLTNLIAAETTFRALPVDQQVAKSYGKLCALIESRGRSVRSRTMDFLIAATAHAINAPLYTKNPKDFIGLEGHVEVIAL